MYDVSLLGPLQDDVRRLRRPRGQNGLEHQVGEARGAPGPAPRLYVLMYIYIYIYIEVWGL